MAATTGGLVGHLLSIPSVESKSYIQKGIKRKSQIWKIVALKYLVALQLTINGRTFLSLKWRNFLRN